MMVLSFIVGSLVSLIGRLGGDAMSLVSFIMSKENFNNNKNALLLNELGNAKKYLETCIQGNGDIPIIRICNYEKMIYELKKASKKSKQSVKPLKEIQLSVNIAKHDLETKANNARKFLEDGSRVRVTLSMKGRELSRREENKKSILEFIVLLEDIAVPEAALRDEGNKTVVTLKKKNNNK